MSLKTDLQNIVEDVYEVLDDEEFLTTVTFTMHTANPTYDPTTRTVTSSTTDYSVNMLLSNYHQTEVDNVSIMGTDRKASIPQNDLTPTPNLKCTVTINDIVHEIIDIGKDVADTLWIFQLRKP